MTTTLTAPVKADAQANAQAANGDICAQLDRLAGTSDSATSFYRAALAELARHFRARYASLVVQATAVAVDDRVAVNGEESAAWSKQADALALDAQCANEAIARLYAARGATGRVAVLAVPLPGDGGQPIGGFALVTDCADRVLGERLLTELRALAALVGARAERLSSRKPTEGGSTDLRGLTTGSRNESAEELAFAVVNALNTKCNCQQTAFGLVEGRHIRILAISGLDTVRANSPGVLRMRQAMEECLDDRQRIVCQSEDAWHESGDTSRCFLHDAWRHDAGGAALASLPLAAGDAIVGVVSLRRASDQPFTPDELTKIEALIAPYGPALLLLRHARRSLPRHAIDSLRGMGLALTRPGSWGRRVLAVAAVLALVWFVFGSMDYTVSVPCTVTAEETRNFAAPFEGVLRAAHVHEGQRVRAGQLLYEMDTHDLTLEAQRLRAEIGVARAEAARALGEHDGAAAAQANARIKAAQARLEIVRRQIELAVERAPADGVVLRGDLPRRVGEVVPLGEPLLEFAPEGRLGLELRLPEHVAADIRSGESGTVSCYARPDQALPLEVERVLPAADTRHGQNEFLAQAALQDHPDWLRVGMDGVARVDTGPRRVWWVVLHRGLNFVRLHTGL